MFDAIDSLTSPIPTEVIPTTIIKIIFYENTHTLYLLILIIGFGLLYASCSSDDPEVIIPESEPTPEKEIDHLQMNAYPNVVDLFELSEFRISTKKVDHSISIGFYIEALFDSVKWNMPDVFTNLSNKNHGLMSVGYGFCLPGQYKMAVSGYRDGKVVSTDTAYVQVVNNKDFMGLNWKDEQNKEKRFYDQRLEKDSARVHLSYQWQDTEYALVQYRPGPDVKNHKDIFLKGRSYLFNLMGKIYGEPVLQYQDENILLSPLVAEYQSRFETPLQSIESLGNYTTMPLAIWETPSTYIALIGTKHKGEGTYIDEYFELIAEPRNLCGDEMKAKVAEVMK